MTFVDEASALSALSDVDSFEKKSTRLEVIQEVTEEEDSSTSAQKEGLATVDAVEPITTIDGLAEEVGNLEVRVKIPATGEIDTEAYEADEEGEESSFDEQRPYRQRRRHKKGNKKKKRHRRR